MVSIWAAAALLGTTAWAADPVIEVRADGTVTAQIAVAASPAAALALIGDAKRLASLNGTMTATVQPDSGGRGCLLIDYDIPHPIAQVQYRARACPVADGWTYVLVSSETMAEYQAAWHVLPADGGGCQVRYEVRTVPSLPIPRWVVERQSSSAMQTFMRRLADHLEGR